jgi:hypothetical protein
LLLSTDIWVSALLKRAQQNGAFAVVVRRGDARAGAVLVRTVNHRAQETRLYAEALNAAGDSIWIEPKKGASEAEIISYGERSARIDPDLWIIEIEDVEGRHFLTEPVN